MQMQRMQIRMKLPFKHYARYAQHFAEAYSEPCQASEMEFLEKRVNDFKTLKTVITKRSTLSVCQCLRCVVGSTLRGFYYFLLLLLLLFLNKKKVLLSHF